MRKLTQQIGKLTKQKRRNQKYYYFLINSFLRCDFFFAQNINSKPQNKNTKTNKQKRYLRKLLIIKLITMAGKNV